MAISSDEQVIEKLDDIADMSQIIVKGYFGEYVGKDNMIRHHSNPELPAKDAYSEGHIYEFHVEKTYKGEVNSLINVMIPYAREMKVYNEWGKYVGNVMNQSTEYTKPDPEQSNILFLNDLSIVKIKNDLYGPGSIPYNIVIEKDDSIKFISKKVEGQLGDNMTVEDNSSQSAYIIHEHRDDVRVDVKEEFLITPNLLKGKT